MKKFQFLLLDAGPIIKLFELGVWESFLEKCDVTISRTVAEDEVIFALREDDKEYIDFALAPWEQKGLKIIDVDMSIVKKFVDKFDSTYKDIIHDGEKETLAFLYNSSENWRICAADGAVFKVLGLLGRVGQGISLEEVLKEIGLSQSLEWRYTKKFREKYTRMGQVDSVQGKGLL